MSVSKMLRNMLVGGEAGLMMDVKQAARDNAAMQDDIDRLVEVANQRLNKAADDIKDLKAERAEFNAVGASALILIDVMARRIAELTGESEESVQATYYKQRSRLYDGFVNEKLAAGGSMVEDPRKTGVSLQRKWYVPEA